MRYSHGAYWMGGKTALSFQDAVTQTKEALNTVGFGVLCDIDIQGLFSNKLGLSSSPFLILGICNPNLSHQALTVEPDLGLMLPCNLIIYEKDGIWIKAIDPTKMLSLINNPELNQVVIQVREKLEKFFTLLPE